ncbi:MAG: VTT domain-containing protein [Coriobacteriales bacterium]|nr:VTT domain-containing protein [Coriobacteriales bacterium]
MEIIQFFIDLLSDPRDHIAGWIHDLGSVWVYVPLFIIIFIETGLVITPFLPGDSLLFAAGFFAADGGGLNVAVLLVLLSMAAILGNISNYWIGRTIGQAIIDSGRVKALTPQRVQRTEIFLRKYGFWAVVLTRFFPLIRTFAPFLAGAGHMNFARFSLFNVVGGVLWVSIFTLLGYFFGGIPVIRENFEWVIVAIVVISLLPTVIGVIKAHIATSSTRRAADTVTIQTDATACGTIATQTSTENGKVSATDSSTAPVTALDRDTCPGNDQKDEVNDARK